jgi:hypothetical protein
VILGDENMQEVVILDPGLRDLAGHHPAILEVLAHSKAVETADLDIKVYANIACSAELLSVFAKSNIEVIPYFTCNFYLHFHSDTKLSSFTSYVKNLTEEYQHVIYEHRLKPVTFYYHTLHWEHAYSLSLAIKMYQRKNSLHHQHLVSLMFNPGFCDNQERAIDNKYFKFNLGFISLYRYLARLMGKLGLSGNQERFIDNRYFKFNLGFSSLSMQPNVSLFAIDHELMLNYQKMLGNNIGSVPCGSLSQHHLDEIEHYKKPTKNLLLYAGHAKNSKGFLELPNLVKTLTKHICQPTVKFTLQYTITTNSEDLAKVDQLLKELQIEDSRIVLHTHFLTDSEIHQLWLQTTDVVINYDETIYQNLSSGILWLAAAYKTRIFLMTDSWLNREAQRLNCDYHYSPNLSELKEQLLSSVNNNHTSELTPSAGDDTYGEQLLSDLGAWLSEQINLSKNNKTTGI